MNNRGSTRDATKVLRPLLDWFRRIRFLKVFPIYGRGSHVGNVIQI